MSEHDNEKTTRSDEEPPMVLTAEQIFGEKREVWIDCNGERYKLRITRRGKLILQK